MTTTAESTIRELAEVMESVATQECEAAAAGRNVARFRMMPAPSGA
jgi:hypothetical protein